MNIPAVEIPPVVPYPGATTRWDYYQARHVNEQLQTAEGNPEAVASILTRHIFETHPQVLDLPPAVLHRFNEANRVLAEYPKGEELLHGKILDHFARAGQQVEQGFVLAAAATIRRSNEQGLTGQMAQRVQLPDSIAEKSLAWNEWARGKITSGEIGELFGGHPEWVGTKLGDGTWLPVGNLMIEVGESLCRVRTPAHWAQRVEDQWELGTTDEWGSGFDLWFVMTHIMDKQLLDLAAHIGDQAGLSDMIDGRQLLPATYAQSYRRILELIDLNPHLKIKGVLSDGTWAYSRKVGELFSDQHVAQLHDLAGKVIELGTAAELNMPAQIAFSTGNPARKKAYEEGRYRVDIAARFIGREGMQAVVDAFAPNS